MLIGALLFPAAVWAQTVNFEEDFSGEDLAGWFGDTANFVFVEENENILLRQNADDTGISYLSSPSGNIEGYWEFFIRMDGFNPANTNKAEIYLMSDEEDLTANLNGYKLRAGETGSGDVFRLFRITNGDEENEVLNGTTSVATGGDFRVKVTRDASGNWTLEVANGYDGFLSKEATGTDNTYDSATHFGFKNTYTSTRTDLFYYDFKIDIQPVEVLEVSQISTTQLDVLFSRAVDFNSVQNSDFTLNPGNINPQSTTEENIHTARLSFSNSLPSGINTITISGIDDLAGETTLADTTFSFTVFDEFQEGNIVINEFLKDPPAGAEEYVELKNTSSRYLNLKDWKLGDDGNLTTISNNDLALLPDSFIVITKDTALNRAFYDEIDFHLASLPAFNNGSDQVRLLDFNDTLIDSLEYSSAWGGVKVALERRDASVSSVYLENWGESPAAEFGTPGFKNQIEPDITAPSILNLTVQDDQTLIISFSERLESQSAQELENYSLTQNPEADANPPTLPAIDVVAQTAADTLEITLDSPLQEYDGYWTFTAENLTDIFGNTGSGEVEFNFYIIITADSGEVAINEFMYDPVNNFSEFIELYNHTDSTFDLQNWTLNDNTGNLRTITNSSYILSSGSFVLLAPDSTIAENIPGTPLIEMGSRFPALNNNTDDIVIRNQDGLKIDSLTYTSSWGGSEVSLERREIETPAAFKENWGDSPSGNFATPGLLNEIQEDQEPPRLQSLALIDENKIQLLFSERLQNNAAENLNHYELSAEDFNGSIPALQAVIFSSPDTVLLEFESEVLSDPDGNFYEIKITNQTDIFGNTAGELSGEFFAIKYAAPDSGKAAITEFMYDPASEFSEFVEIYNTTDSALNLQNWTLNDNTGNRRIITNENIPLKPNAFLLLTPDSTIIESFPDAPLLVLGTRFSSLNNNTDAIVIRDNTGALIDSLTYTSNWGGKEVSVERRSTEFPAQFQENWGSSPSAVFATPGLPNEIQEDKTAPEIKSYLLLDENTLQIVFTERIKAEPATNLEYFGVSNPASEKTYKTSENELYKLEHLEPDTIHFTNKDGFFSSVEGNTYEISVRNQEDIFGNVSPSLNFSIERILVDTAFPGEVLINEFMYDPVGEYSEFIELANFTSSNFDLKNWSLSDNTGNKRIITTDKFILRPDISEQNSDGVYVVLAPDSSLLNLFPERPVIVMGNSFPALNNNTDAIVIRNENGEVIDSLTYTSDWGGREVSLERRTADAPSVFRENWGNSPSVDFATPGLQNEILPDNDPPEIADAFILNSDSVSIIYNERIDSVAATNPGNFTITPNLSIEEILYNRNEIKLALSSTLNDGETYSITIQNQKDVFGNIRSSTSVNLEFIAFSEAEYGDIIINEILYRRASSDSPEFIELFNKTSRNFDLNSWTFSDAGSATSIPAGSVIRSGEYLILTDREEFASEIENGLYLSTFPSLNDDEDAIIIKNSDGEVIDSLFYKSTWGTNQPGVSLERKDPGGASNDASNWASSISESGNTLSSPSSVFEEDVTPPEIIFSKLQPDNKIYVAFSEFVNLQEAQITVGDQEGTIAEFNNANANIVWLEGIDFETGEQLHVRFENIADVKGNTRAETSVEVAQPLAVGNVVINEIMFDPLANSDDNLPDQTEYIEFYNRADYAISLEGFFLHDEPDENQEVRSIFPVSSQFKWIPPKEYVLVFSENLAVTFAESQLAEYFELENPNEQLSILINRSSLSLASSGDAIYLADSTGANIDSVFFDEGWQNPNLHSTKGIALERIDPDGASDEESNWSSSTNISGGTPGWQNSIFQQAGAGPVSTGINFTPNPFSPDDDGFDDNLFLNYKLNESDYLLRIRIFDRYGREVRKLTDGKPAGFEGSLIWDGLTDDRRTNRVGFYIVLFEAFDSANGRNITFKKTVVLARKF